MAVFLAVFHRKKGWLAKEISAGGRGRAFGGAVASGVALR
ncbi:hypothetical protein DVDV_4217 [Desulfovibrio sp. DV]|nr:hypothetical protein DVDV_4217 [Desulfovibrio sp. DV]